MDFSESRYLNWRDQEITEKQVKTLVRVLEE